MIENLFTIRKNNFEDYPGKNTNNKIAILKELDIVEEDDQITHEIELDDKIQEEEQLDYFHFDKDFEENEEQYNLIRQEILGEDEEEETAETGEQNEGEENKENENKTNKIEIEVQNKDIIDTVKNKNKKGTIKKVNLFNNHVIS
jgi:pre-mRNA-splicing factor CWC22